MIHCMIDLETWGKRPGCVVRSIGAVVFDPATGETGAEFYANLLEEPQLAAGLAKDPDTETWWARQSSEAQAVLLQDQRHPIEVVRDFHSWWSAWGCIHPWSHGKEFDLPIWETMCTHLALGGMPWNFYATMDTRTVYLINGFDQRSIPREGVHHNALDDARHQARCVAAALKRGREYHEANGLRKAIERQLAQELSQPMKFETYEVDIIVRTSPAVREVKLDVPINLVD
jgi:hypothetical protein